MITLENVRITDQMLEAVRYWQEEDILGLESDIKSIDDAITFIACEHECPRMNTDKEALTIIANLSYIKRRLIAFDGREVKK